MSINYLKNEVWEEVSTLANDGALNALVRLDLIVSYESAGTFKYKEALRRAICFYSSDQQYIDFLKSQGLEDED